MTDLDDLGARYGMTRAPGEDDGDFRARLWCLLFAAAPPVLTKHEVERRARAVSRWVRRVLIENPEPGTVVIRPRGPLNAWLPERIRGRVDAEVQPLADAITIVRVER